LCIFAIEVSVSPRATTCVDPPAAGAKIEHARRKAIQIRNDEIGDTHWYRPDFDRNLVIDDRTRLVCPGPPPDLGIESCTHGVSVHQRTPPRPCGPVQLR
jgi:hypothetical protein